MAATVSAWSKPGAWALDSEENEQELLQQHKQDSITTAAAVVIPESDFPSLDAVAKTKSKKKKPQTLSLHEFSTYSASTKQSFNKGLTPDELLMLPTAPKERTAEELNQSRLGGGFRSYDNSNRGSRDDSRRGGFDKDSSREFVPSRADENDNWGAGKKTASSIGSGFDRRDRGGDRGGFFTDSQSRAVDSDNWASNKSFVPSEGRRSERRGLGFESNGGADSENWLKKKEVEGQKFGGSFDSLRSRRGGIESPDSDTWGRKKDDFSSNGNGNGNGNVVSERPRLNLKPRTKPLDDAQQKGDGNGDVVKPKGPSPFGEAKPRDEVLKTKPLDDGQQKENDDVVKPKGSNPFGEARPREEVLKEKGQDWKEIDEKLEAVKVNEVKEAVKSPDAKKGFGFSNARASSTEGAWRRPGTVELLTSRSVKSENGHVEETQDGEAQA